MIYRSKAPLRLGLAGGGTDVSAYSDTYGGAILNACISLYAYASIRPLDNGKIIFNSIDKGVLYEYTEGQEQPGPLPLHEGVYKKIRDVFLHGRDMSFELTTSVDAPPGSGLGSSSTLVVAMVGAFAQCLKLPLGEYDIARMAYDIERNDLGFAGGKQDQYAATFGGVNFMEFYKDDKVIVNPLRIRQSILHELAYNILLFNTSTSRLSSKIIEAQEKNVLENRKSSVEAMHKLKEQALMMKEALLKGEFSRIGSILDYGWEYKKRMAEGISNSLIDNIYTAAKDAGASGGKISGAGGGGFMIFFCPDNTRNKVMNALKGFGGEFMRFEFSGIGLSSWTVNGD